jgi:molybdenum cofactor guanylyltransferase
MARPAAVLCGGASRRMGRDKALIPVEGVALAVRAARAVAQAGAAPVVAVGGDGPRVVAAGIEEIPARWVPDRWPGEGPLGGLLTALAGLEGLLEAQEKPLGTTGVLVVACDLVTPSAAALAAVRQALEDEPEADVVLAVDGQGRRQWLHGAWRFRVAAPLTEAFVAGERALHRAVDRSGLRVHEVTGLPRAALADADVPADLPGAAGPEERPSS